MAFEYAALVAIFIVIGLGLDKWLGSGQLFVVIFVILGLVGGFLRLMYGQQYDRARRVFRGLPADEAEREIPDALLEIEESKRAAGERPGIDKQVFDSKTGLVGFKDYQPSKYGERRAEPTDEHEKAQRERIRAELEEDIKRIEERKRSETGKSDGSADENAD